MTKHRTPRFSNGAWLVLLAALLLLLLSLAQVGYRFTLPTDGWSVYTEEIEGSNWFYDQNLVEAASDLQSGDAVLAVDGRSVSGDATTAYILAPANWQIGQTVTMRVLRGEVELDMPVPLVGWTATAVWHYNTQFLDKFVGLIGAVWLMGICWFTFLRRPENPSARALLILGTAIGAAYISGLLPDGLSIQFNQAAFYLTLFFSYAIFGTLIAPSLLVFALLFPHPKRRLERHPWLALLPYAYGLFLLIFLLLGGRGEVGWLSTMGMFFLAIVSFVHAGFTQRDAASRMQLRWAISGFVVGLLLFGLNFPMGFAWVTDLFWINLFLVLSNLGLVAIGTGLAVAVLRYRLYDIDVIIRKTVQYGVLTAVLALVYFGAVILLQSLVEQITDEQSPLVIVLSTLLIAALFNPLRRRVQDIVDRRFYRQKVDAQLVLTQFAQTARDETDMATLQVELLNVVQETLQPEQVFIWLKSSERISS